MAADLAAADAVAAAVGWLRTHPSVIAPGGVAGVSGLPEAPWPHLVVSPSSEGDLRGLRWDTEQGVQLEVYDDPAGTVGRAALWQAAIRCGQALVQMGDAPAAPGLPVVAQVVPSGVVAWTPLDTGQGRWTVGFLIVIHP